MKLYTIGFTKKSSKQFFDLLKANNVRAMADIRLNNSSQLAGFTKCNDLEYFLKAICMLTTCTYCHLLQQRNYLMGIKRRPFTGRNMKSVIGSYLKTGRTKAYWTVFPA